MKDGSRTFNGKLDQSESEKGNTYNIVPKVLTTGQEKNSMQG